MRKRGIMPTILTVLALVTSLLWSAPAAVARTPFDGKWSVLIVTDAGTCDRAYRYGLDIVNGRIFYPDQSFDISGRVDARGRVDVSVSAGGQRASGSGQAFRRLRPRPLERKLVDIGMLRPLGSRAAGVTAGSEMICSRHC